MPNFIKYICFLIGFLLLTSFTRIAHSATDPVNIFIHRADSLLETGGDELLAPYIDGRSIIVGAVIGQLLKESFEAGTAGDTQSERKKFTLAERVAHLYKQATGSEIPLQLVTIYKSWTPEQRILRNQIRKLEKEAFTLRDAREYDKSIEVFHEVLDLCKQIDERHTQAVTWGSLGVAHWYRGDFNAVKKCYNNALASRRAIEERILEGRTLNGMGSVYSQTGNYDSALVYYDKAIELRRKTQDYDGLGISLTYKGNIYYFTNRLSDARVYYEEALSLLEVHGTTGHLMEVLNNIASLYSETGHLKTANDFYRRGIDLSANANQPQDEAICRMNLAENLRMMSQFEEALEHLAAAEPLLLINPERIKSAHFVRDRGLTYMAMGELDKAREELLAYLKHTESLPNPSHRIEALIHLCSLYEELEAYDQGLQLAEQAQTLARESNNVRLLRDAHDAASYMYQGLGRYNKAINERQRALKLNRQEGVEASILKDKLFIANMYAGLERNDKARKGFYAALPDVRASGQPDLEWGTHLGIGHTFMKENSDSARFHYERTLKLIEETRSGLKGAEIRTGYLSGKRRFIYEEIARYYASQHKMDEEGGWSNLGFRTIERAKARGLLDLLEVSLLAESPPDEMAVLDSLYQCSAERPEDKEMHNRLERRYINMREERLSEAIGPLKSASTTATIPNIQDELPKGTVLLEYALGDTASLLWVIDQKKHSIHELPNRQSIRMDIERLRDAIARPGAGDAALTSAAWRLYEKLILPVENKIRKAKQLVIVPDGILFELPFEVLITKETDAGKAWDQIPFLTKTHTTLYIPSASIYLRLMIGEAKKSYTQELVAFGDPDFSLLKDAAPKSQTMLAPLPHTRVEVNNIAAYLDEPHRMIFLGDKATEGKLKKALRSTTPRLLHLATHGLVDPIDPQASSIVLCPDSDTNDDGYLHTLEILNLPLEIRLVVMSACESARGRIGRGEGVVGLSRAFIAGGAGGVVASLWSVSDQSTAELMNVFYKEMVGKKKSASEALRKARLMLLEHDDYAHPFYWSAFIMIGTTGSPW